MVGMYHLSHLIAEGRRRDMIASGRPLRPPKRQRPRRPRRAWRLRRGLGGARA